MPTAGGGSVVRVAAVTDPALAGAIAVGDELLGFDGVSMADYVASHPFESNALNPVANLEETAATVVSRPCRGRRSRKATPAPFASRAMDARSTSS